MEEDPYANDLSDDEPWPGETDEFEAGDITIAVPKELANKSNTQIGRFFALRLAYGTALTNLRV